MLNRGLSPAGIPSKPSDNLNASCHLGKVKFRLLHLIAFKNVAFECLPLALKPSIANYLCLQLIGIQCSRPIFVTGHSWLVILSAREVNAGSVEKISTPSELSIIVLCDELECAAEGV